MKHEDIQRSLLAFNTLRCHRRNLHPATSTITRSVIPRSSRFLVQGATAYHHTLGTYV